MAYLVAILSCIYGIVQIQKLSGQYSFKPGVILVVCILVCLASVRYQCNQDRLAKFGINQGVLDGTLGCRQKYNFPCMAIGGAKFLNGGKRGRFGNLIDSLDLDVYIKNGKLLVTANLFNSDMKLVTAIKENEFTVSDPSAGLTFDRNFDDNGMEVMDNRGKIILQVYFENGCVHVGGIFYKPLGRTKFVALFPCAGPDGIGGCVSFDSTNVVSKPQILDPIFVYPSKLHPGERVNSKQ